MSTQATPAPLRTGAAEVFLKELRQRTAAAHEALEALPLSQRITDPDLDRADYISYLQVMQHVVASMELVLHPLLKDILTDIDTRSKTAWTTGDLAALGASENPYPPFTFPFPPVGLAYGLGAYYVLEGSTLGGRVILKSLPQALIADGATAYFEGYGAETGSMWKRFLEVLSGYAAESPMEAAGIINGAEDTFAAIRNYFNDCALYDAASGHR